MTNLNNPVDTTCIIILLNFNYKITISNAVRKQDAEYTRRKKNLIASRRLAKIRTIKIIKSQIVKRQDHSTLLNSTEVWREKCKMHDLNTKEPKKLQYIKDVPRLYVVLREGMLIFNVFNLLNIYLNISSFQICPMEEQGIAGDQGHSNVLLKSKIFFFYAKCIYNLTKKAIKKYMKRWYILIFIFLYERTFLFPSDDEHNKLWVNECWIYPRSLFHTLYNITL